MYADAGRPAGSGIMGLMRRLVLLLLTLGLAFAGKSPQLDTIHTVYFLSMGNALDQYLATQLTSFGLFQVVTDPEKADAVFTDKIGKTLEDKLDELYPPETPKKTEEETNDPLSQPQVRVGSGISKGRGTVYLIDRKTRNVVWSIYMPVRGSQPDEVNRRARSIADQLRKEMLPPK
jgi:hypothetical protein